MTAAVMATAIVRTAALMAVVAIGMMPGGIVAVSVCPAPVITMLAVVALISVMAVCVPVSRACATCGS